MNETNYNNQAMTDYLLGALPDAVAEHFDELSFTDDRFAAALDAAEKELVDAYALGDLTGAALAKFESHYLSTPARREKVRFARAFQIFAEKAAAPPINANEKKSADAEPKPKRNFAGFFSGFFGGSRSALKLGFAAVALALTLAGGWLFLENLRLRDQASRTQMQREESLRREQELQRQIERERSAETERERTRIGEERARLEQEPEREKSEPRQAEQRRERERLAEKRSAAEGQKQSAPPPSIASFVLLPQLRGGNNLQTLALPPRTNRVALRVQLAADDYAVYRVALRDQTGARTIWRGGNLKARNAGETRRLNVSFPARLLKSQIYVLQVTGVGADGSAEIVGDYPFKVVR